MKIDFDFRARFHRLTIQIAGLVMPIVDRAGHAWQKRGRTVEWLQLADAAVLVDHRLYGHGTVPIAMRSRRIDP